ncbi:hypothetical protein QTO34_019879 [Cnephaeus nilssonii]|uniref:Uncharacterized protein n=1 Tax=Cnephaeus nilssonii TaxID=3371016 RepID=A0AA40HXL5_CNENI|nr:hypothetical protein QTO34_019879 [Eptesicus nilssonii]
MEQMARNAEEVVASENSVRKFPSPNGSAPTPKSIPTTSLLKLWSPFSSFWHPVLASDDSSIPSSSSCTSPWATSLALHLNPAYFSPPDATVRPPPDIYTKALATMATKIWAFRPLWE